MTLKILSGEFKGRLLKSPSEKTTRPTQGIMRAAVFNICQQEIEGANFLDLFAGSGAMGLEALSRGACHATFVEKDHLAAACIRENIKLLKVNDRAEVFSTQALVSLNKMTEPFDIIYIDPPYDTSIQEVVETILAKNLLNRSSSLKRGKSAYSYRASVSNPI
jgi:RNA methyltransferase, RsmD family